MEAQGYSKLVEALRYCSTTKGMVYCNVNCKYGWEEQSEDCKDLLMTDAAAAIEELEKELEIWTARSFEGKIASMALINLNLRMEISKLKAQLPKLGEWIKHPEVKNIYGGEYIECPFCGEKYVVQYIADEKFCRNCGADMRAKMEVQE